MSHVFCGGHAFAPPALARWLRDAPSAMQNNLYRAALPAWIFIGGLSLFPWLIVWENSWSGIHIMDWVTAAAVSGFCFSWLGAFQIVITPTELIFRSLFCGKQRVKHTEIDVVRLEWNFRQSKSIKGPLRLIVEPKAQTGAKKLDINAKVFSRAAINAVLALGSRVARSDDQGLRKGIVVKSLRSWRRRRNSTSADN